MNENEINTPSSYDKSMADVHANIFVVCIPTFDEKGPMVMRACHSSPLDLRLWSENKMERAALMAGRMMAIREQKGFAIPRNEDYARGRDD